MIFQQPSAWVEVANSWVGLVAQFVALFLLLGGALQRWLNGKLNGMGERVKEVEVGCTKNTVDIDTMKARMQASEFDRHVLHENVGKLEGMHAATLAKMAESDRLTADYRLSQEGRLTRIETLLMVIAGRLDVPTDK